MIVREVSFNEKERYNSLVKHPVQSWEWGVFKERTGVEIVRLGSFQGQLMTSAYQLTFHPIPNTSYSVGYLPKGPLPDKQMLDALLKLAGERQAVFIKLEPNVEKQDGEEAITALAKDYDLRPGKSVFTPYTFRVNLTRSEDELLAAMNPKTRYNVRLAQRKGVVVVEDNSEEAFYEYLRLTFETAKRHRFYAHDEAYQKKMWDTLYSSFKNSGQAPIAHLLTATWGGKILVAWVLFIFNGVLYYPYGASSDEHRDLMASNLMMWEAMRFGKRLDCNTFDLWGSLGPNPDPKDPWYGFHRFKAGYGGELVEFVGTWDLVIYPQLYSLFRVVDDLRWKFLRLASRFR